MNPSQQTRANPADAPTLSVIVPAYNCAPMLQVCLDGLAASDLPRDQWELLVVNDGSTDDTPQVAERVADAVHTVAGGPRGPAHARNLAAQSARAPVLVFVDADVVVAPTTLSRFATLFEGDHAIGAAFGAYDDTPADPRFVSQYRNLLHRYVHTLHPGEAETFWAGCGAVRRDAFLAAGGFDSARYPRPQIEDIDLGYRLRARGERIVLDPALTGTHLKRWTLANMLRTDLRERAIPWMHLLLWRKDVMRDGPLNLASNEKVLTALAGLGLASVAIALLSWDARWLWLAAGCALLIALGNARLIAWFARCRGWLFALATIPLRILFYVVSAMGAAWAILTHAGHITPVPLSPLRSATERRSPG